MLLHGNPPPQNNNSSRFDGIFDEKRGSGASTNILSRTVLIDHEDNEIAAQEELNKAEQFRILNIFRPTKSGMIKTQLIDAYN